MEEIRHKTLNEIDELCKMLHTASHNERERIRGRIEALERRQRMMDVLEAVEPSAFLWAFVWALVWVWETVQLPSRALRRHMPMRDGEKRP